MHTAQAQALHAVQAAAHNVLGHTQAAICEDGAQGIVMYGTTHTIGLVFAQALAQLGATQVEGYAAVLNATGQTDHHVTFMLNGHELYFTTCYESCDNLVL